MKVKQARRSRSAGTYVALVDNRALDYDEGRWRWYTVCLEHGGVVGHRTQSEAHKWLGHPRRWCPCCPEPDAEKEGPKAFIAQRAFVDQRFARPCFTPKAGGRP